MQVELIHSNARMPSKGSAFAAGHDLYAAEDLVVPARFDVDKTLRLVAFAALVSIVWPHAYIVLVCLSTILWMQSRVTPSALVATGVRVAIQPSDYGRIAPRSGLALKYGVDVGAGVIDSDYRGEIKVLLFNFGAHSFRVRKGDRIAQLILERINAGQPALVSGLSTTERGIGGFGSTGPDPAM